MGVCLLTAGNLGITTLLGRGLPCPAGWLSAYLLSAAVALLGALGYFLLAACVCHITQNQPAAMCICGLPFGLSYFINVSAVKPFGFFWFFRYGFFTELMRGRLPDSHPGFWAVWYGALLGGSLFCALHRRKERKEL